MTSAEPILSLSCPFWSKLKSLSTYKKDKFIASIYTLIASDISQVYLPQSLEDKSLVFLMDKDTLIFIVIYLSEQQELVIKIVDYLVADSGEKIKKVVDNYQDIVVHTTHMSLEGVEFQGWGNLDNFLNLHYELKPQHLTIENEDFWCYFPDIEQKNNCDLLSTQQYQVIQKHDSLPAIIMGDRGTGKTKTALYSALKQAQIINKKGTERVLYITDSKSSAKQLKRTSYRYNKHNNIDFFPFLKLSKIIVDKYPLIFTRKFLSQREINFYKFREQFFKPKKIFMVKPEELWQEIKYLIKGSNKAIRKNKSLLSFADYLALKKQSILPEDTHFKLVYDFAIQYQDWLESQKYWDELDLTRYLLNQLPDNYLGEYEAIYIDGIEQLSEIQTRLLFKLLKVQSTENYLPKLFLIGNQEISLFQNNYTWNRVKKLIIDSYHKLPKWKEIRALIEPKEFIYSFIYLDTITQLTSTVANFIGQNLHHSSWLKSEQKPLVISDISQDFLTSKSSLNLDCAIIVFNEQEKKILSNIFPEDSERIIKFSDSENLDFEQVLIWKLFEYFSQLHKNQNLTNQELDFIKYNYVALCAVKGKKLISFYDEYIDNFWNNPNISNLVEIGYQTELESMFGQKYSEAEIIQISDFYLTKNSQKAYEIANQIYDRYQTIEGKEKVSALLEEIKGNHGKAGDIWNTLGVFDEAINSWNEVDSKLWLAKWSVLSEDEWQKRGNYFEVEKDYHLAKFCFEKANYFEGKLRCLEQDNEWELAGDECQARNLIAEANKYYQLADKYYREHQQTSLVIKMWTKLNQWEQVASIWQELEQWEKAGNCWQKFGDMQKAAFCWQKAEKWVEAQKCWQELGNWEELAISYETQENWQLAGQTWLKVIDKQKAAVCYEKANLWHEAEQIWAELGYWGFVAVCLQQQEKWIEAAEAWSKTNPHELQALCYEKCEDWAKAEQCWFEAKNWTRIIIACEKQGKWLEAAESWENLGEWQNAAGAWQKIKETEKAALCYEQGEYWYKAEECWRDLHQNDRIANTLEKQGEWELAANIWQGLEQWQQAGNAWQNAEEIEKAALCFEKGQYWREAEECWRQLKNWAKVENACQQQGEWQKAAYDWLQSNQIEKAALCYEKCQDWEKAAYYWEKCGSWEKLVHVCQQLQEWEKAASAYLKIDQIEEAALCYEKCENWSQAEDCWRQLNNWEKLALVSEKQNQWEEAAQLWYFLEQWEKAAEACLQMDDTETAIKYYEKGGYQQKAQLYRTQNSELKTQN